MSLKSRFLDLTKVIHRQPRVQVRHTQAMMPIPMGSAADHARYMSRIMASGCGTHHLHELPAKPQGVLRGVLADYAEKKGCSTEDLIWKIDRKCAVHVQKRPRIEIPG
jgi:hypothetical protein